MDTQRWNHLRQSLGPRAQFSGIDSSHLFTVNGGGDMFRGFLCAADTVAVQESSLAHTL